MKKIGTGILAAMLVATLFLLAACGDKVKTPKGIPDVIPEFTITMEDGNVIKGELYPKTAPNTVCNFIALAQEGYFDGLQFYRIVKDFVLQTGSPMNSSAGNSGFTIAGEFPLAGFAKNTQRHVAGTLSMARLNIDTNTPEENYNSASDQFFIVTQTSKNNSNMLDDQYAPFGLVTEGLEFVQQYENRNTDSQQVPYDPPIIKSITIDTKGKDFPAPIRVGERISKDYQQNPTSPPTSEKPKVDPSTPTVAPVSTVPVASTAPTKAVTTVPTSTENVSKLPIATIKMTDGREIKLALYPAKAPITVANFIDLANNQKFYDNVSEKRHIIFHRIAPGFMIQAGDITASGAGQSGFAIKGEFKENNVETNDISFVPGVIGMARSGSYDSASTQFFITVGTPTHLDGQYAAFGRVISGMDVVQAIANIPTGHNPNIPGDKDYEFPLEEQRIASIRVDTKGVDFTAPPRLNVPIA